MLSYRGGVVWRDPRVPRRAKHFGLESVKIGNFTLSRNVAAPIAPERSCGTVSAYRHHAKNWCAGVPVRTHAPGVWQPIAFR
jgi:hypothetical protein